MFHPGKISGKAKKDCCCLKHEKFNECFIGLQAEQTPRTLNPYSFLFL